METGGQFMCKPSLEHRPGSIPGLGSKQIIHKSMEKIQIPSVSEFIDKTETSKTIVISFGDIDRMMDFCKDKDRNITRDFFDWYLIDNGEYFARKGVILIDKFIAGEEKLVVSFDLTIPDNVNFELYRYSDQSIMSHFIYKRQENLTMTDIVLDIKYLFAHTFKDTENLFIAERLLKNTVRLNMSIIELDKRRRRQKRHLTKDEIVFQKRTNKSLQEEARFNCELAVYTLYSLMYYVSRQKTSIQEISSDFSTQVTNESLGKKVEHIYKYTGYVDLSKNKVYKPIVKKDPDEPIREYQRHIEKWTVRGHYRRTSNGLIWIEPHEKGQGEVEKRIYGEGDGKALNLIPKEFVVERTIKDKKIATTEPNALIFKAKKVNDKIPPLPLNLRIVFIWTKITSTIVKLFNLK